MVCNQQNGTAGLAHAVNATAGQSAHILPNTQPERVPVAAPGPRPTLQVQPAINLSKPGPPPCGSPSTTSPIPREYRLVLTIDSQRLTYDARHVPDPPIQHFSKNINLLFDHWTSSRILSIVGRMGLKRKAWEAIKVEWCNWKVKSCASRVRAPSSLNIINWPTYSLLSRPKTHSRLPAHFGMRFEMKTALPSAFKQS